MNNIILEFLEQYKHLDELCKQILSSDRGITEYIEEMDHERQGNIRIAGWERDYRQLKKMRWIRNQLVHDSDSFHKNLVSAEDIEWLKNFQSRVMKCTDPFSLLYQEQRIKKQVVQQEKSAQIYFKIDEPADNQNLKPETILVFVIIVVIIFTIICFINFQ